MQQDSPARQQYSSSLDGTTVMAASIAIASEVEVASLPLTLVKIVSKYISPQKLVLISTKNLHLSVDGQGSARLSDLALTESREIPQTIVNYVRLSHATLLINQPEHIELLTFDPYFIGKPPLAMLCVPLLEQSHLIGLIYLENPIASGIFTDTHSEFLQLLCSQAILRDGFFSKIVLDSAILEKFYVM